MTKQEIIERLNKVCEASQNGRFTIEASVRGGKLRQEPHLPQAS